MVLMLDLALLLPPETQEGCHQNMEHSLKNWTPWATKIIWLENGILETAKNIIIHLIEDFITSLEFLVSDYGNE